MLEGGCQNAYLVENKRERSIVKSLIWPKLSWCQLELALVVNFLHLCCTVLLKGITHEPGFNLINWFIPENCYSGWENLSLHSWEPLERGRHKHSLPSGRPLQQFCLWNPRLSVTWSACQFPLASVTGPEECFDKLHNALISRAWPLPECGKVSSAQNLSISRDGIRYCWKDGGGWVPQQWSVLWRWCLWQSGRKWFWSVWTDRRRESRAFKDDSESGDELDDENLPLFFTGSATFWVDRWGHCCDTRHTSDVQCRCVHRHSKYSCTELQCKYCAYIW